MILGTGKCHNKHDRAVSHKPVGVHAREHGYQKLCQQSVGPVDVFVAGYQNDTAVDQRTHIRKF